MGSCSVRPDGSRDQASRLLLGPGALSAPSSVEARQTLGGSQCRSAWLLVLQRFSHPPHFAPEDLRCLSPAVPQTPFPFCFSPFANQTHGGALFWSHFLLPVSGFSPSKVIFVLLSSHCSPPPASRKLKGVTKSLLQYMQNQSNCTNDHAGDYS